MSAGVDARGRLALQIATVAIVAISAIAGCGAGRRAGPVQRDPSPTARLTGGAWCRFDPGAAAQLRELLRAAAAYAAGGREALLRLAKAGGGAARLIGQMK